jgi:predicted DNA-binding transcriptional regulator AlpA
MTTRDDCRPHEYISEQGLHERYLIAPRTAQRWRSTGEGPRWIRLGRRRVLYRVSDVEAWLAERTYVHRADELTNAIGAASAGMADTPVLGRR